MRRPVALKSDFFAVPKSAFLPGGEVFRAVKGAFIASPADPSRRGSCFHHSAGKEGGDALHFRPSLCSFCAPKPTLSPPFPPHSSVSDFFARCKLGVLVSAGAAT
jgi:hypothetical protein